MSKRINQREALSLTFKAVDIIIRGNDHEGALYQLFKLSENYWSRGIALTIAERQALLTTQAAQTMPDFLLNPSDHPHRLEDYEELERIYHLYVGNIPELATKYGPQTPEHEEITPPQR